MNSANLSTPTRSDSLTCAATFRPDSPAWAMVYHIALVLAGSGLITAGAYLQVRLPISVVPVTGQTLAVLLVAALLGSRLGVAAVLAYLVQGAWGLPVFAGGAAGAAWLAGPTGGYLAGFVLAAFITGLLAERGWDRTPGTAALAMLLGNLAIYCVALPWLALFVGPTAAIMQGLVPFIPGAVVKIALASMLLPLGWTVLRALDFTARKS